MKAHFNETKTSESVKLLPCPCCGNKMVLFQEADYRNFYVEIVSCPTCGLNLADNHGEALNKWNSRVSLRRRPTDLEIRMFLKKFFGKQKSLGADGIYMENKLEPHLCCKCKELPERIALRNGSVAYLCINFCYNFFWANLKDWNEFMERKNFHINTAIKRHKSIG